MKPAPAAILLAAGLGAFFVAKRSYDAQQREIGAVRVRLTAVADSLKRETARGDSLERKSAADSQAFVVQLARWQALKQRVVIKTKWDTMPPDTVPGAAPPPDTVVRPPTLAEAIAAADKTINACSDALNSCQAVQSSLRSQLGLMTRERDLWKHKASPSLGDRLRDGAIKVSLGYLLGRLYP